VTDAQAGRFTVEVSRVLKGEPAATKVVTSDSSRGHWNASVGETRVVFARGGTVGGWSDPVDQPANVRSTLRAIDSLPDATLSLVEVDVVNIKPLPGHRFDLYGGPEGRRTGYSDDAGYFLFRVQPGKYRLDVKGLIPLTAFSLDDMEGFELKPGQCAQFRFSPAAR
jgi:hypothetical protein